MIRVTVIEPYRGKMRVQDLCRVIAEEAEKRVGAEGPRILIDSGPLGSELIISSPGPSFIVQQTTSHLLAQYENVDVQELMGRSISPARMCTFIQKYLQPDLYVPVRGYHNNTRPVVCIHETNDVRIDLRIELILHAWVTLLGEQ